MKLIRVTAMWCTSCLLMKKRWNKAFSEFNSLEIIDYDFDEDTDHIQAYNIGSTLPVVLFVDDSLIELERMVGEKSVQEIVSSVRKYLT
ncbi:MAG: hypothetical protein KKE16_06675 [Firmicutes bacterium]|nr:hypothetical protein [Bacillota bacterium]